MRVGLDDVALRVDLHDGRRNLLFVLDVVDGRRRFIEALRIGERRCADDGRRLIVLLARVRRDSRETLSARPELLDLVVLGIERGRAIEHLRRAIRIAALEEDLAQPAKGLLFLRRRARGLEQRRLGADQVPVPKPGLSFDEEEVPIVGVGAQGRPDHLEGLGRPARRQEVPSECVGWLTFRLIPEAK